MKKEKKPFRILHTADWHLGKLLGDQSRDEEHGLFLDWLIQTIETEEIDEVLIAGDIFDTATPPNQALERYYSFISRLHKLGTCSLTVIAGNHDSPSQLEAPKDILRVLGVEVAGVLAEKVEDRILVLPRMGEPQVVLALLPFLRDRDLRLGRFGDDREEIRRELSDGIRSRYAETADAILALGFSVPAIGTGHLTVLGSSASDSERSIHIGGLGAISADLFPPGFEYIALGHIHRPQSLGVDRRVRYAGSPIPLSFSEAEDGKSVQILEIRGSSLDLRTREIPRFRRLLRRRVPVSKAEDALVDLVGQPGELEPWVEVTLYGKGFVEEAMRTLGTYSATQGYRILKVLREEIPTREGDSLHSSPDDVALSRVTLLDSPQEVFNLLLSQRGIVDNEETEELRLAFHKILDEVQV